LKSQKVILAACGRNHTLVYTGQGKLYSTGGNSEGQLGLGDTKERTSFQEIPFFNGQYKIKQLSAGSNTSAALTVDGKLFMWGDNTEGQLGLNREPNYSTPQQVDIGKPVAWISCGYYHSAFVTQDGELYTFGEPENGKLGQPPDKLKNHKKPQRVSSLSGKVKMVSCGGEHTIAVSDKEVYTFGFGQFGQLGHGTFVFESQMPKVVDALKKQKIKFATCGENHTAVITDNGLLYTFGDGRHGKLGLGEENFTNQFAPTLCLNFLKFTVQSVSCGGCHMLVFAKPRTKESEIISDDLKENYLALNSLNGDSEMTSSLQRSYSARLRRREKEVTSDHVHNLSCTLPPLRNHSHNALLPVTSNTVPPRLLQVSESNSVSANGTHLHRLAAASPDETDRQCQPKQYGDATDVLNMTHAMSINPANKSLNFSPVQKRKEENNEEESEEDDDESGESEGVEDDYAHVVEDEEEGEAEEVSEEEVVDTKTETNEVKPSENKPGDTKGKMDQNKTDQDNDHTKSVGGIGATENSATKPTLLEKTKRLSFFKRLSSTSQKTLQDNKENSDSLKENRASDETHKRVAKGNKKMDVNENHAQENSKGTKMENQDTIETEANPEGKKIKSSTCVLL
ncbi:hypothetical protein GDO86_002982, partial [Hymenochirus boettgeri]